MLMYEQYMVEQIHKRAKKLQEEMLFINAHNAHKVVHYG
jgi:hypothetical protein